MTEKQIRSMVSRAMAAASPATEGYYHLCWWEDQVRCLPAHHTTEAHEVFYSARGRAFVEGLSAFRWRLVTMRITDYLRNAGIVVARGANDPRERQAGRASPRCVTEFDATRLSALLTSARSPDSALNRYLDELLQLLEAAEIVGSRDVPGNVVTMNSRICLKDDRHTMLVSLVFPANAADAAGTGCRCLSVLTPLGLSILGRRVGDMVDGALGIREMLYQPEAAGDFDL